MHKPMKINLQLFAEETIPEKKEDVNLDKKPEVKSEEGFSIRKAFGLKDKEPEKVPDKKPDVKPDEKPEVKPLEKKEPETKEPEVKQDEDEEVVYNGKTIKVKDLPKEERKTYLQKGMNYDKVKTAADTANAALQRVAKLEGFDTVEKYLAELDNREKAKLAEKIEEAAGDPDKINEIIENHPKVVETREESRRNDYVKAKAELSTDKFFKELEPELDRLMEQNPTAKPDLVYKIIRSDYLTPDRLNELITKEKASTEKKILADVHDKERRAAPTGGDTTGEELPTLTGFGSKLAGIFGLDDTHRKEMAKARKK